MDLCPQTNSNPHSTTALTWSLVLHWPLGAESLLQTSHMPLGKLTFLPNLGKSRRGIFLPTIASHFEGMHFVLVPSQHVRKSLGSCSIGDKDRNSRRQWTLVEMRPKLVSLVHKCILSRKHPWPKCPNTSPLMILVLKDLPLPPVPAGTSPASSLRLQQLSKESFYPMSWTPRNPCLWFQVYIKIILTFSETKICVNISFFQSKPH